MSSSFNKLAIDQVNVNGKRVLMRVDFNVPIKVNILETCLLLLIYSIQNGKVANNLRVMSALPTIQVNQFTLSSFTPIQFSTPYRIKQNLLC